MDLCEGVVDKGGMVLMRDISLAKEGARGELLYNKLQDFIWDDVLSKYLLAPEVCMSMSRLSGVYACLAAAFSNRLSGVCNVCIMQLRRRSGAGYRGVLHRPQHHGRSLHAHQ